MLIMGDAMHMWGQVGYGKYVCLPFTFAVNIILLRKINSILKMG